MKDINFEKIGKKLRETRISKGLGSLTVKFIIMPLNPL